MAKCDICKGSGFVRYERVLPPLSDLPYGYIARCACPAGSKYAYDGRQLKGKDRSPYYVPSVDEIFPNGLPAGYKWPDAGIVESRSAGFDSEFDDIMKRAGTA